MVATSMIRTVSDFDKQGDGVVCVALGGGSIILFWVVPDVEVEGVVVLGVKIPAGTATAISKEIWQWQSSSHRAAITSFGSFGRAQ